MFGDSETAQRNNRNNAPPVETTGYARTTETTGYSRTASNDTTGYGRTTSNETTGYGRTASVDPGTYGRTTSSGYIHPPAGSTSSTDTKNYPRSTSAGFIHPPVSSTSSNEAGSYGRSSSSGYIHPPTGPGEATAYGRPVATGYTNPPATVVGSYQFPGPANNNSSPVRPTALRQRSYTPDAFHVSMARKCKLGFSYRFLIRLFFIGSYVNGFYVVLFKNFYSRREMFPLISFFIFAFIMAL